MSSSDWERQNLEDVLDALIDYRGKTPQKTPSGIPLITAKIVKGGSMQTPEEFIAEENYTAWMTRGLPQVGDVVLTTEAPLGEVAQLKDNRVALAQRIVTLRGRPGVLDNGYLKYFLLSEVGQARLKERETGTTVTGIKQSELRLVKIDLPPFETQRRIAAILSALDDKIELNRQTNAALEAIALAIFKEWFVDFNFPGATGEMVESELGMIPQGWRVEKLGDVVDVKGGTTPSTKEPKYWDGEFHWATPKDLSILNSPVLLSTERRITREGVAQISSGVLPKGTLLLSSRAPIGYLAITDIPVSINQGFIAINGHDISNLFILYWLKANMERIISRANGSTFLEISKSSFRGIGLVVPDPITLGAFDNVVSPLFEQLKTNEHQSAILNQLRDNLLPKLMSGEIEV
jgi:type I restriction enzyme, S subunit